jgi:hypothetical protein
MSGTIAELKADKVERMRAREGVVCQQGGWHIFKLSACRLRERGLAMGKGSPIVAASMILGTGSTA